MDRIMSGLDIRERIAGFDIREPINSGFSISCCRIEAREGGWPPGIGIPMFGVFGIEGVGAGVAAGVAAGAGAALPPVFFGALPFTKCKVLFSFVTP